MRPRTKKKNIKVPMPDIKIAKLGSRPMSSGAQIVEPNIATTCCAAIATLCGKGRNSSGKTTVSDWVDVTRRHRGKNVLDIDKQRLEGFLKDNYNEHKWLKNHKLDIRSTNGHLLIAATKYLNFAYINAKGQEIHAHR